MRISTLVLLLVVGFFQAAQAAGDPYSAWARKYFGSPASPIAAPFADPDGDGLVNLLEYTLNTDPTSPSEQPQPFQVPIPWLTGEQTTLVFTAAVRTDDPSVKIIPQVSEDAFNWFPFVADENDLAAASADGFYAVKVDDIPLTAGFHQIAWAARSNVAGVTPHFMRLTVVQTSTPVAAIKDAPALRRAATIASTPTIPGLSFTGQLYATVGGELTSNTVKLRGFAGTIVVTAPDGVTLIVNGKAVTGKTARVKAGDTLALRVLAPSQPDQPHSYAIKFANGATANWTVGSKRAAALTAAAGTVSGYTPVSASVGAGGDANVSIPITVSPGIGGMEPKLSIGYSSQGGNGQLGVGFNLSGLSAIGRVGATQVQDSYRGSVKLDANDRFALDGARLISVTGADGGDGTIYEKELHDFSRIRSFGRRGSGPATWKVETKAGLTFEYGTTDDSQRIWAGDSVLVWFLAKVTDTVGNEMRFTYIQENGSSRISHIDYTFNITAGADTKNRVEFTYEQRPDSRATYLLGIQAASDKRLAAIDCKHDGNVVRRYELSYQQSELSGQSQLIQVVEKGQGGATFAPTVFTWNQNGGTNMVLTNATQTPSLASMGFSKSPASFTIQGDFNGDGRMDIAQLDDHGKDSFWIAFGQSDGSFTFQAGIPGFETVDPVYQSSGNLRVGDFNADGRSDLFYISENGSTNWVAYSNGNGSFEVKRGSALGGLQNIGFQSSYTQVLTLDANGDGRTDVIVIRPSDNANIDNQVYLATDTKSFAQVQEPGAAFRAVKVSDRRTSYSWILPGDYNGDGLADLLHLYYNAGNENWLALSNGDGTFTVKRGAQLGGLGSQKFALSYSYFLASDTNGDGLTDIVHFTDYHKDPAWTAICKGDGTFEPAFHPVSLEALPIVGIQYTHVYSGDLNGDGVADILSTYNAHSDANGLAFGSNGYGFTALVGAAAGAISQISLTDPEHNPESRIFVGDFDGDGTDDVVVLNYAKNNFLVRSTGFNANRLEKVTNGHGGYTRFEYKPMTDPSVYTKGTGAPAGSYDFQAPMPMVSRMVSRNGADGDPNVPNAGAPAAETAVRYRYEQSVAYLNGRGLQGPRVVRELDETTEIETSTVHAADPLLSGFPVQKVSYLVPLSRKINESLCVWTLKPRNSTAQHKTYFAFASATDSVDYEVNTGASVRDTYTAGVTYDGHGNLLTSKTEIANGPNPYVTTTVNTYTDQESPKWILGRLSSSTVVKTTPSGSTSTRKSTFAYHPSTGLLISEIVEPDNAKLRLEKSYTHDAFGSITESSETAWDGSAKGNTTTTRTRRTVYSPDRRFIENTFNAMGHKETTLHEPLLGQVTYQQGPNKIETRWEFDGFGRPVRESRADGSETRSWYLRATPGVAIKDENGNPLTGPAPARAVHAVITRSSAAPAQTIWYDVLDREIQRDAIGFDGAAIFVRKIYNDRGQTIAASNPTFSSQAPAFTTMAYDAIGREIQRTLPGGFVSTVSYNGLTTTATNSEGQKHTRTASLLDKLDSALDHFGKPLSYQRDAAGNLTGVTDSGNHTTSLTFDNRGNKTSLTEPNTGKTTYDYSGFGELIAQTTSDGLRTTFEYDTLGRLTRRSEFAPDKNGVLKPIAGGVSEWFYDNYQDAQNQFAARSLGKLIRAQNAGFREDHRYDSFGRPVETITRIGVENFSTTTSYDYVGRVDTVTYPTAFAIRNFYNGFGHLAEVQNAASGTSFWKATQVNARGQVEQEALGNGLITQRTFYPNNGLVLAIQTGAAGGSLHEVQNLAYNHNSIGTFVERKDIGRGMTETFSYDKVNRLKQVSTTGVTAQFPAVAVSYDDLGNPTSRTDAGTYTYSPTAGPHAVTGLTGRPGGAPDLRYSYDARGNRIKTERKTGASWTTDLNIKFNTANLPVEIASPSVAKRAAFPVARKSSSSTFSYTPDRARYRQVQKASGAITVDRFYIGSLYEREQRGSSKRHIHYIPAGTGVVAIQQSEEGPSSFGGERTLYVHKDHLGSVESLTNQSGGLVEHLSFDAWGRRRDVALTGGAYAVSYPAPDPFPAKNVSRGFTGHEMLDAFGIVHMNGRLYDPLTGRFLSADPIVQELDNLQNLNRYSYVLNNPLTMTDPSGFSFLGNIGKWIGKNWKQIVVTAVAIVLAVVAAPLGAIAAGAISGFGSAFTGTLLAGGSIGDAFRAGAIGGAWGALSGAAASGIGGAFQQANAAANIEAGPLAEFSNLKPIAHGLTQGAIRSAQGGKFAHGFLSGGFADLAGGYIGDIKGTDTAAVAARTAAAAIVGGTAEKLGGGKFANGAVTGAFVHLFNYEGHLDGQGAGTQRTLGRMDRWISGWSDGWVNRVASLNGFDQDYVDTLAGFENAATLGGSSWVYEQAGLSDGITTGSSAYRTGGYVGLGAMLANAAVELAIVVPKLTRLTVGANGLYYGGRQGAWSFAQVSHWYREVAIELGHVNADLIHHRLEDH